MLCGGTRPQHFYVGGGVLSGGRECPAKRKTESEAQEKGGKSDEEGYLVRGGESASSVAGGSGVVPVKSLSRPVFNRRAGDGAVFCEKKKKPRRKKSHKEGSILPARISIKRGATGRVGMGKSVLCKRRPVDQERGERPLEKERKLCQVTKKGGGGDCFC